MWLLLLLLLHLFIYVCFCVLRCVVLCCLCVGPLVLSTALPSSTEFLPHWPGGLRTWACTAGARIDAPVQP